MTHHTSLSLLSLLLCSTQWLAQAAAPIDIAPKAVSRNFAGFAINKTTLVRSDGLPNSIYNGSINPNPGVPSRWDIIGDHRVLGISTTAVPGTNKQLYIGRTRDTGFTSPDQDVLAAVYDVDTSIFTNITVYSNAFCGGQSPTHDGRVAVVGGTGQISACCTKPSGMKGFRAYNPAVPFPANQTLPELAVMKEKRWYPSAVLMPDNTILVLGGTTTGSETGKPAPIFERWDPKKPAGPLGQYRYEPTFFAAAGKLFYPAAWVLPTGDVFILQDQVSRFLKQDNTWRFNADGTPTQAPLYPAEWKTQFPRLGSAVMTALTPDNDYSSVDIIFFGGSATSNGCIPDTTARTIAACPYSFRLTISWTIDATTGQPTYSFSEWIQEDMGIPRVGLDATLLPNGQVILAGGAQTGCSCGVINGVNRGNYPALWAQLYQTEKDRGSRYTILSASTIARIYHTTHTLTMDGTITVQGCDACKPEKKSKSGTGDVWSPAPFWSPGTTTRWEYRVETFYPPYALDTRAKPKITSVTGLSGSPATDATATVDIAYGQTVTLDWEAFDRTQLDLQVTKVSLVAPSAVTHSINSNQRVVFLKITNQVQTATGGSVTVSVPTNINILPAQSYMLFIMNGNTYSRGWWVRLTKP